MESDSAKVGHSELENQATPADPQLRNNVGGLYGLECFFVVVVLILLPLFQDPFKPAQYVSFVITTIVSLLAIAIFESVLIIFTSHFLQSLTRDIHYTAVFKRIGCFLAAVALFIPPDNALVVYRPVVFILSFLLQVLDHVLLEFVRVHQPAHDLSTAAC